MKRSVITSKVVPAFVVAVITLLPTWIGIACYFWLGPSGFWEKLTIVGLGVFLLGSVQLFLLIVGGYCFAVVINKGW